MKNLRAYFRAFCLNKEKKFLYKLHLKKQINPNGNGNTALTLSFPIDD